MPLTRRTVPLLATAALLLWPVVARGADPTLSLTPPPGLRQSSKPKKPHPVKKPSHPQHRTKPHKRPVVALPHTGADLTLEAALAAMLIAGGTLLRAPRYLRRP